MQVSVLAPLVYGRGGNGPWTSVADTYLVIIRDHAELLLARYACQQDTSKDCSRS